MGPSPISPNLWESDEEYQDFLTRPLRIATLRRGVSPVVLDTDVASAILKERLPGSLAPQLAERTLAITFATAGEVT